MLWFRRCLELRSRPRGCHLITSELIDHWPECARIQVGFLHVFIQHTSASLTINENADADVRRDLAAALDALAPENFPYIHTLEGMDDMPAHVKASLMGSSVTVPVQEGTLLLGTWQGIYLCEHRDHGGARRVVLTLYGSERRPLEGARHER